MQLLSLLCSRRTHVQSASRQRVVCREARQRSFWHSKHAMRSNQRISNMYQPHFMRFRSNLKPRCRQRRNLQRQCWIRDEGLPRTKAVDEETSRLCMYVVRTYVHRLDEIQDPGRHMPGETASVSLQVKPVASWLRSSLQTVLLQAAVITPRSRIAEASSIPPRQHLV